MSRLLDYCEDRIKEAKERKNRAIGFLNMVKTKIDAGGPWGPMGIPYTEKDIEKAENSIQKWETEIQVWAMEKSMYLVGKKVRMTEACKKLIGEHGKEFEDSIGVVEGLIDYGDNFKGPEIDVRWDGKLRYGYHPDSLEIVE